MEAAARSREVCPECGGHSLELIYFPSIDVKGVSPYDELIGMGDLRPEGSPGIGCRLCGATWPDLDAFREAAKSNRG